MCLQSLMSSTPPFLGTNAKKVAFKLLSNVPDLWKSFKNQNTQPWTVDPKLRNKTMVNLSGPKLYPCLNQVMLLAALLHWKDPLDPLYPPPPAVWKAPFLHQGDGPLCLKEAIGNIQKSISSILTPSIIDSSPFSTCRWNVPPLSTWIVYLDEISSISSKSLWSWIEEFAATQSSTSSLPSLLSNINTWFALRHKHSKWQHYQTFFCSTFSKSNLSMLAKTKAWWSHNSRTLLPLWKSQ